MTSWTYNSIAIYVQGIEDSGTQIIARLQPVNNKTVLQVFGWESDIYSITALIATDADRNSLRALRKTGSSYSLSGPEGAIGNFFLKSFKASRTESVNITIFDRPSLDSTSPVYTINMELYLDE